MKLTRQRWLKLSGWTIPLAYAAAALGMAMIFPRLEHRFLPALTTTMSPAAAMAICSAIAGGMISLTGIVFSLSFVMVQFSAMAYSPRLVLWVARDPVMSHALGVFSATFLYALGMIGWVDRESLGRVPLLSSWLVLALLLASVGMFIALIERIGRLQVNRMLIYTGDQGRRSIDDLYQPAGSPGPAAKTGDWQGLPVTQTLTHTGRPQVIQAIQIRPLVELAAASGAVIEVVTAVGDTVLEMTPLLRVRGARQPLSEASLKKAIEVGDERTFDQDPKYAFRLVVEFADAEEQRDASVADRQGLGIGREYSPGA